MDRGRRRFPSGDGHLGLKGLGRAGGYDGSIVGARHDPRAGHHAATGGPRPDDQVMVVDDHAIVRQGLERLLATTADLELVGMAANGGEAIELAGRVAPDVVLMDLSMAGTDGVEATRRSWPVTTIMRVVVLDVVRRGAAARRVSSTPAPTATCSKQDRPRRPAGGDPGVSRPVTCRSTRARRVLLEQRLRQGSTDRSLSKREERRCCGWSAKVSPTSRSPVAWDRRAHREGPPTSVLAAPRGR